MASKQNSIQNTYMPDTNIYKYSADMKFVLGSNDVSYIDSMNIKSIAIDSDYKNTNMPMIFITLSIDKRLIDKMVKYQGEGIIILTIARCVVNSDMPELYTDYINDKFIYFISEDINKNDIADYEGANSDREDIFKLTTIGLLSLDHVNKNKKSVNGVISGKLSSIMYYLVSHLPVVIEPPDNNIELTNQFLPPINSVSKALNYINSIKVFYSTKYRFFIDFDVSYLISSSGKAVKKQGENINSVFIEIRNSYDQASKLQGMKINEAQSMYYIECDGIDCELSDNHILDKTFSKLSGTDTSGRHINTNLSNISKNSPLSLKTKSIRISNDNEGIVENIASSFDSSSIQLLVQKTDIDASVLTMNKEYIIKADDVYNTEEYNGHYILTRKRELYIREDEDFALNTMLLFEKVSE